MTYYCNTGGEGTEPQTGSGTNNDSTTQVTAQNSITGVGATSDSATIISRMQQRRGLKQDLPQPLRPGELGFTIDSQQVFIGADPQGAPSFNKTSVFENTLNSRVLTESLLANQVFEFRLPFKKYARGEFTGATNTASWLPTSFYKTGISDPQQRVFSDVFTSTDSVFDVRDGASNPRSFVATDLVVKRNSVKLNGNDNAQYNTLVIDDYIFSSGVTGNTAHSITLRTRPEASDEITVSYYDYQVVPRVLSVGNGVTNQSLPEYFPGFYQEYNVPQWDRIDDSLISYSDTTGRGFLGLEFKHISVRAQGNVIATPNNVSLGTLRVSRNAFNTNDTGNIVRLSPTDTTVTIPVGVGHSFSNSTVRNNIVVSAGLDFVLDPGLWIDGRPLPVVSTTVDTVVADISITGVANRVGEANANPMVNNIITVTTSDTSGIATGDTLYFYGTQSSVLESHTGNVMSVSTTDITLSVNNTVYTDALGVGSPIPAAEFVNYGNTVVGDYVQIMSPDHGLTATNSANVVVVTSTDGGAVTAGSLTAVDYTMPAEDWFYLARTGNITQDLQVVVVANEPLDYGDIASGFSWWDDLITVDLSGASSLTEAAAIVNDLSEWPMLQIVAGTNDQVMLTQNPAYDSTGREFIIYPDPANTAQALGLQPGTYTLGEHTRRSQLEKWFQAALNEPNFPVFNQVNKIGFGSEFYSDLSDVTSLGTYELDIDETFNEIRFGSREEAIAFNTVVNNLYYRANNSDIRGLVNIKSNLELEIKQNLTVGDKTVTYVDMNVGNIGQNPGPQAVPGLSLSTSEFNVFVIEYSIQEAITVQTVPGANYARVGTMKILYRRNFDGLGNPQIAFYEDGSDIVDTAGIPVTTNPILQFSAQVDSQDPNIIQILADNQTGWPLTMKYIMRRWNSQG